tara:strand:+ start:1030 stop:1821 length:792 start_codon:yes stop_codon:yes gene_type:complete
MFSWLILEKKNNDKFITMFNNDGFVKLNINLANELDYIKNDFKIADNKQKRTTLELAEEKKPYLKEILNKKLSPLFDELRKHFNSNIIISNVEAFRTVNVKNLVDGKSTEIYSNHYHNDGYLLTYVKLFINLMDVNENDGPLHIISKKKKKEFFKITKYKNRNNYSSLINNINKVEYKNIGKFGDCFLFSSPQCMHKAGIPENYRDMMQVSLMVTTKSSEEHKNVDIFQENKKMIYETTKPYKITKMISLFFDHLKFKAENKF